MATHAAGLGVERRACRVHLEYWEMIIFLTILIAAIINTIIQYFGDQLWIVAFDRTYWEAAGILVYHFSSGMWRNKRPV